MTMSFEPAGTGALLREESMGRYHCRTCDSVLFDSGDRLPGADDYATFKAPAHNDALLEVKTYTPAGEEQTTVQCAQCTAPVGFISNFVLRSADDLEQGREQLEYKVSSSAVSFKPVFGIFHSRLTLLLIVGVVLIGGAYAGLQMWGSVTSVSRLEHVEEPITFWINDQKLSATVVPLEQGFPVLDSLPDIQQGTLLLSLPPEPVDLRIRLANQLFEVLWLDENMGTIRFDEVDPAIEYTLSPPNEAVFGLVARSGTVPQYAQTPGYKLLVLNKGDLL
jgi:peptide methionine sulfoxide reductase MsrB